MFEDPPGGPRLDARPSVAVEIDWAMSAAARDTPSGPPALHDFFERQPELRRDVRALWGDAEQLGYPGFPEVSILAHAGGALFGTDGGSVVAALAGSGRRNRPEPPLAAETPADRQTILSRLEVLRTSKARRDRYGAVVRRVWAGVRPIWEPAGRAAVESAVARRRAALATGPGWEDFTRGAVERWGHVDRLVAAVGTEGEVVIVPAFFNHRGLLLDLAGLLLIGVPADSPEAASRARTEGLARRLRAISEPTRLAMLDAMARRPMTVSELAGAFGLAQPTVSNHARLLRDAGVVAEAGDGRRRAMAVDHVALAALLDEVRNVLGPSGN